MSFVSSSLVLQEVSLSHTHTHTHTIYIAKIKIRPTSKPPDGFEQWGFSMKWELPQLADKT